MKRELIVFVEEREECHPCGAKHYDSRKGEKQYCLLADYEKRTGKIPTLGNALSGRGLEPPIRFDPLTISNDCPNEYNNLSDVPLR